MPDESTRESRYVLRITQASGEEYRVPSEGSPHKGVSYPTAIAQALQFGEFDDAVSSVSITRV